MSDKPQTKPDTTDYKKLYEHIKESQGGESRKVQEYSDRCRKLEQQVKRLSVFEGQEQAITARLQAIEAGYAGKVKQLELSHYTRIRALEAGVKYELLENYSFESTKQIDAHVGKLQAFIDEQKQLSLEKMLVSGKQPQAGNPSRSRPTALDDMVSKAMQNTDSDF